MPIDDDPSKAVLQELHRLVGCKTLHASDRNRQFLRYVVTETLEGRGDRLKAYNIATSVFGRGSDFNPQQDAIVRIEAGRLRQALEHYYLTDGQHDRIRITIPVGSYVPTFEQREPVRGSAGRSCDVFPIADAMDCRPSILVANFEDEGDQSMFPNFTKGFLRRIVVGLAQFTGLQVYGPETIANPNHDCANASTSGRAVADFILTGGTAISDEHFSVEAVLFDSRSSRCVWAQSFDRILPQHGIVRVRNEVASSIASTLGLSYGYIANASLGNASSRSGVLAEVD